MSFWMNGGQVPRAVDAEELGLYLVTSKADVYNAGERRNHWRSGDSDLCVLQAVEEVQRFFPERFGNGSEADLLICRTADGRPVHRAQTMALLSWAAEQEGFPSDRYGSHSLRVGGATALYHAGVPVEIIKRYGRWVSDCFQGYLWESNEDSKDLARRMAQDASSLTVTRGR